MKITGILFVSIVALATAEWNKLMEAGLYQGDMALSPSEIKARKNAFGSTTFAKWPKSNDGNVHIPYVIENAVNGATNAINQAINSFTANTCIRFNRVFGNARNTPHIRFVWGSGCSSPVGRKTDATSNNWQEYEGNHVTLYNGVGSSCWQKGTVIHEIMHSLGFQHEQSRPDRNNWVNINWGNIKPDPVTGRDTSFNFNIENNINSLGYQYDYDSVMHYDQRAFGGNDITITTINQAKQNTIGTANDFSFGDIAQINALYNCP